MTALWLMVALLGCDGKDTAEATVDADGDGVPSTLDCDDGNAAVAPGLTEVCDDLDNDCDGLVDDEDSAVSGTQRWYADGDGDGFGDADTFADRCALPDGYVPDNTDCDDSSDVVFPGGFEVCDGLDNDCDGLLDDADPDTEMSTWYEDNDGDGFGQDDAAVQSCEAPDGFVADGGDCNDGDDAYYPNAPEEDCQDPNDYNCDGTTGFFDGDKDGWPACEDCNDALAEVFPGAPEVCNGIDDDCDDDVDVEDADITDAWLVYPDSDGDGHGDEDDAGTAVCSDLSGHVDNNADCDDSSDLISPDTRFDFEDRQDNDCDGSVDEDVGSERYSHDADIQSIWNAECGAACHLGSSSSGGISLRDGYTSMVGVASKDIPSMALVEPGDPDGSYLWLKLNNTHLSAGGAGSIMPKSGALPSSDLAIIETWILEGAVE